MAEIVKATEGGIIDSSQIVSGQISRVIKTVQLRDDLNPEDENMKTHMFFFTFPWQI